MTRQCIDFFKENNAILFTLHGSTTCFDSGTANQHDCQCSEDQNSFSQHLGESYISQCT